MTVTVAYDGTLSRVRITANALAAADVALIERSTDQVTWTTVRGASAWPVTAGALALTLDDYEFAPGVINYYRVRGVETADIGFVAAGTSANGNNASVVPTIPGGVIVGDVMFLFAAIRSSGTGTVNTPTGWTDLGVFGHGHTRLFARAWQSGDSAPTVAFTGGAAGDDTAAQIVAFRRVSATAASFSTQLNGSAQDIAYPALAVVPSGGLRLYLGWRQDDWTSVATIAGATEIAEITAALGSDMGMVWDYDRQLFSEGTGSVSAGSFTVTGGVSAISRSAVVAFEHAAYLNEQTANITPVLDQVWIKNVSRPYLNAAFSVSTATDPTIGGRGEAHEIVGRSLPVGITDVAANFTWEYVIRTPTEDDATKLRLLIASGDVLFIQVPAASRLPSGYVLVGQSVPRRFGPVAQLRHHRLACREVAAPSADIVGGTSTWADVIASFATWADVIVTFPTWADLLGWVANPGEVIVP